MALAIDPSSSSTLYAGTFAGNPIDGGGVFKSTDSGATWSTANAGLIAASVLVVAIDPSSSSTLYAETDGDGVFKSTDRGATWSAANTGLHLAPVTWAWLGRPQAACSPSTPRPRARSTPGQMAAASSRAPTPVPPGLLSTPA